MRFVFWLLLLSSQGVFSQGSYTISGTANGPDGKPVITGEALLLNASGILAKTALIESGMFIFSDTPSGSYSLQLAAIGYETTFIAVNVERDMLISVTLKDRSLQLQEVVINSESKTFSNKSGNIKVDVSNSIFKASPSPLDLLAKLPTVIITADKESIGIIGRGNPLLYIDNQKATINDLNTLSVGDIKTIEIIKNPSVKYEAEGRAVILITRKRSRRDGLEVSGLQTASVKRGYNNYNGVNTGFKTGSTEIKANVNYNQLYHWESNGNSLVIDEANIKTNYKIASMSDRQQYIFGAGVFQQLDGDDYLSANFNAKLQADDDRNRTQTFISLNNNADDIATYSQNDSDRNYVNSFLNYSKNIKSLDAKLFTGLQYSNFYQTVHSDIQNNYNSTQFVNAEDRDQKFTVNAVTGRADAEKIFKNDIKLEIGGLYLSALAKTIFDIEEAATLSRTQSIYNFKEQNSAGYMQLSGKVKKITYSGGLRVEVTDVEGRYQNSPELTINKYYANLFPKVQFDFAVDSINNISLNYAKSIARPNYSSTSQVTVYGSPFMVFANNLNLNPAITNEVSLGFQRKDISATITYYITKNPSYSTFTYDATQTLISLNTANYEREWGFNLETVIPFNYKFWTVNNVLSLVFNKIEDPLAPTSRATPYLYYNSNNTFKLPKEYTVMLSLWGTTKRNEGIFTSNAFFIINLGITRTFRKTLDCTLSFNDIFRNMNFDENFTVSNISSKGRYYTDTGEISLSLKYKFGNFKGREGRKINDNEGRIK